MSHSKSIKGPIAALDRNKIEISPFFLNEKNDNYFHNEK